MNGGEYKCSVHSRYLCGIVSLGAGTLGDTLRLSVESLLQAWLGATIHPHEPCLSFASATFVPLEGTHPCCCLDWSFSPIPAGPLLSIQISQLTIQVFSICKSLHFRNITSSFRLGWVPLFCVLYTHNLPCRQSLYFQSENHLHLQIVSSSRATVI